MSLGSSEKNLGRSKWVLLGLLSAVFSVNVIDVFAPLLYPEIAADFHIFVGTAVQLSAFSALAGVIAGLLLSAFSIRFRYKTLLMAGVLAVIVCILGVWSAPSFVFAQIFYSLNGFGSAIVAAMSPTLIAELYPLKKKAVRISWSVSTAQLALLIGNPVTGFISNSGGVSSWRSSLLWFLLPVTAISMLLVFFLIPSTPRAANLNTTKVPFLEGYRRVVASKSALACLSNSFFAGAFFGISTFHMAFLSVVFGFPPSQRGLVAVVGGSILISGILTSGLLVNRLGRKHLLVGGGLPAIILVIVAYVSSIFFSNVWLVLGLRFCSAFFGGLALAAGPSLMSEQVPQFRGTVMSMAQGLSGIGGATGIFLGGALLDSIGKPALGYPMVGLLLGGLGVIGSLTVLVFAKDPCLSAGVNSGN